MEVQVFSSPHLKIADHRALIQQDHHLEDHVHSRHPHQSIRLSVMGPSGEISILLSYLSFFTRIRVVFEKWDGESSHRFLKRWPSKLAALAAASFCDSCGNFVM